MKKLFSTQIFVLMLIFGVIISLLSFKSSSLVLQEEAKAVAKFETPENISTILDKSCFGCHNVDAKSEDARDALLLDELPYMKKYKIISKLDEIAEVVKDGDMPPSKFLKKYPEKALTSDESKSLSDWALQAAEDLMK